MSIDFNSLAATRTGMDGSTGGDSNTVDAPAYQYGADNHNYGNGNFAITDPSSWGDGLDSAGKFIQTAALSGLNSFYNSAATIGNWLGADVEQNDTGSWISSLDTDLGQYYQQNKSAVDIAGFVATSLIPGLGGVKLLNAGQKVLRVAQETGSIGANLSRATGLLTPSVNTYRTLAAADIAQSAATFSSISGNALKAIGAGYGQAALESAAFETAVAATSFKSPTLDQADGWDIAKNIAIGTVTGGVIGGAINHAISVGSIKSAVKGFNVAEKQFADTSNISGLTPAQRIIARNDRLQTMPEVPTAQDIASGTFAPAAPLLKDLNSTQVAATSEQLSSRLGKLREETINSLNNKNAIDFQELTSGKDAALARQVSDFSKGLNPEQSFSNMESLIELGRVSTKLDAEKDLAVFNKKQVASAVQQNLLEADPSVNLAPVKIGYVSLRGENVGSLSFDAPKILSIADTVPDEAAVRKVVSNYGFKENKIWNATDAGVTHTEAEARYIWADSAAVQDGMKIGEYDIPLLEKATAEKLNNIEVVSNSGNYVISTAEDLAKHLQVSKQEVASELLSSSSSAVLHKGIGTKSGRVYTIQRENGELVAKDSAGNKIGSIDDHTGQEATKEYPAITAGVDVNDEWQKEGIGRALYAASKQTANGNLVPSGNLSEKAIEYWKRNNPTALINKLSDTADKQIIAAKRYGTTPEELMKEFKSGESLQERLIGDAIEAKLKGNKYSPPWANSYTDNFKLNQPSVKKLTTEEIAKITNVRQSYLEGEISPNQAADLFARQTQKAAYAEDLRNKGIWTQAKEDNYYFQPSVAKAAYDTSIMNAVDSNQIAGMAYIKAQQKLYQQGVDTAFAAHVPEELAARFWHPGDDMMLKTNRFGAGPGLLTFANGGYHTPESWAESIGSATSALRKSFKDVTTDALSPSLYKIATNQDVAIEFESINKKLQSTAELYGINPEGTGIEPLKILDYKQGIKDGVQNLKEPVLQQGAESFIPITNPDVLAAWNTRTELTGSRTQGFQEIRNAQGLEDAKDIRALRPIRPDPKDYPYYAVVVDPTITGVGHKSMIHAASANELDKMIAKVPTQYEVYKGDQLKQFFKSQGEFDWEMTLHENYINSDLKRSGVNNPFFIRTDPELIAKSLLQDHLRSDDIFARELVNAKYEKEFSFLRNQGEQYTNTATSRYTGSYKDIENTVNNPYGNYIKTALDLSQMSEHPLLMGLNQKLDSTVSKIAQTIGDAVTATKSPEDLAKVNQLLSKYGIKSAYYDAATDALANHTAPKGVLTGFVSKANAMLSTLVTRLDPFNSINNAVGATVLYGSELKSFIGAMDGSGPEIAGALNGLLKTPIASEGLYNVATAAQVPQVTTAGKIMQQAIANWFNKDATTVAGQNLRDFYKTNGWSTRLVDQHTQMMDALTLAGNETAGMLQQKTSQAFAAFKQLAAKGEVITGNKYVEEMNRFLSADSMRQLTDIGVAAGKISPEEQLGYINTFVNRTQGNILASQRPLMFQGAIGQAVGLFQSYQFNMMQQLFRHVSEGSAKDAAMLLGLQGTMYGMNGLPAFNFLNTHIVGTLSGNPQHTDAYSTAYGIAGKNVGDLLLYGLPSNLFRANLYSRGDINPRQVTVLPTNPVDIPFINATMKMYDTVATTLGNAANGATIWQSLLTGIEHNGLSRPLAGLAQTAEALNHNGAVFSTTAKGGISASNELYSWATATRLAGAKPIDEAIANDAVFRLNSYKAADTNKLQALSSAIKLSDMAGTSAGPDQVATFAQKYAEAGGKQQNFNRFMINEIRNANTSAANRIMENLKSPYAQKMQQIMGGNQMADGRIIQSYGTEQDTGNTSNIF